MQGGHKNWSSDYSKLHKSPSVHHRTNLLGYIFATNASIDIPKKVITQQYLLHMSSQYGELWPTNGWHWLVSLGHSANFNTFCILASLFFCDLINSIQQRMPPTFGWVAIMFGIGPHSTPCLKKTSQIWLAITLTHVNRFWYFLS